MKVLLVSYYFPPMGGAGVQRVLKFAKYLPSFGIRPLVLTAEDAGYVQDASLLAEVPAGMTISRVSFQPLLQRLRGVAPAQAPSPAAPAAPPWRRALKDGLLRVYANCHWPDDRAGWARRARAAGDALIERERPDLILSSAPPMSTHALAAGLARRHGLPWVMDYRDLWTENPAYAAAAWRRRLDRHCESRWFDQAAGLITVTPSWQQLLQQRLGGRCLVRFIPNGYDEADFAGLAPPEARGERVLTHTGTFYGPRGPGTLLEGLRRLLIAQPAAAARLRLRLLGNMGGRFAELLAGFEREHPGVLQLQAYVPHLQALQAMGDADALLLVVGAGERAAARATVAGTLPGKLFEYLRSGRPIFLLGDPEGDAARILRAHAAGWVVDETDPAAIAAGLARWWNGPTPDAPAGANVAGFERHALTGELARFLRDCAQR